MCLLSKEKQHRKSALGSILRPQRFVEALPFFKPAHAMESGQTLLIIDDNAQIIHLLTSLVEGQASVHFAKGGHEGIQLAKTLRPDVVLTTSWGGVCDVTAIVSSCGLSGAISAVRLT